MAHLDANTLIGILQGRLGDIVFAKTKDGRVIVRHRPMRKAPFTPLEASNQSLFTRAARYVRSLRNDPEKYAEYQAAAKARGKRACELANADFRHPPEIHDVDLSGYAGRAGDSITVRAVDDFGVSSIFVTLTRILIGWRGRT